MNCRNKASFFFKMHHGVALLSKSCPWAFRDVSSLINCNANCNNSCIGSRIETLIRSWIRSSIGPRIGSRIESLIGQHRSDHGSDRWSNHGFDHGLDHELDHWSDDTDEIMDQIVDRTTDWITDWISDRTAQIRSWIRSSIGPWIGSRIGSLIGRHRSDHGPDRRPDHGLDHGFYHGSYHGSDHGSNDGSDHKSDQGLACSRLSVRTIEKASGRQSGSAASGIQEWKGKGAPSFSTRPRSFRPLFQSSTLTESLEQANHRLDHWSYERSDHIKLTYTLRCIQFFTRNLKSCIHIMSLGIWVWSDETGVHVKRSEIWSTIKRELLGLKCVGNTTRQWTTPNEGSRLVGDCLVSVY